MTSLRTHFVAVAAAAALLAPPALAQFAETMVEPVFQDCSGTGGTPIQTDVGPPVVTTTGWVGNGWGGGLTDLDADGLFGADEDNDGDAIFSTIQAAVNNLSAGGTVQMTVPGIYREQVSINASMTLRAAEGIEVILEGSDDACPAGPPIGPFTPHGIEITADDADVLVENVTIRGFNRGIEIDTGYDRVTFVLRHGRIEKCTWGVFINATDTVLTLDHVQVIDTNLGVGWYGGGTTNSRGHFKDSEFLRGSSAFWANPLVPARLLIQRTRVSECTGDGMYFQAPRRTIIEDSDFTFNGGHGVNFLGSTNILSVSNSSFVGNLMDGIHLHANGTPSVTITDSRVMDNTGDGVETVISNVGNFTTFRMWQTAIQDNGGIGLNAPAGTIAALCNRIGLNVLAGNLGGNDPANLCTQAAVGLHLNQNSP